MGDISFMIFIQFREFLMGPIDLFVFKRDGKTSYG